MEAKPIALALLDNDELTLGALKRYLCSRSPRIHVLWATTKGQTAINRCLDQATRPDVLLADMSLSDMEGVDVVRRIRRATPFVPILAITSFPLNRYASAAACAGAQGIVAKRDLRTIIEAIEQVSSNQIWAKSLSEHELTHEFMTSIRAHALAISEQDMQHSQLESTGIVLKAPPNLSERERQTLNMYAQGHTTGQVAESLGVSVNTIKTYTTRIFTKLGVSNRGQAIAVWMRLINWDEMNRPAHTGQ